jgi:hypothetical protein
MCSPKVIVEKREMKKGTLVQTPLMNIDPNYPCPRSWHRELSPMFFYNI